MGARSFRDGASKGIDRGADGATIGRGERHFFWQERGNPSEQLYLVESRSIRIARDWSLPGKARHLAIRPDPRQLLEECKF